MAQPESLNLWDRLFNRTRKEVADRGDEHWGRYYPPGLFNCTEYTNYTRRWVEYRTIDRVTGSETLKREYLN